MDTRQNEREAAPTGGPRDRRSRASREWGPGVLAIVALVAVIGAAIWAVASGDGSSVRPESPPVPSAPPQAVGTGEEDAGTIHSWEIYRWDPSTGDVRVVHSAQGQLADAELSPDGESLVYEGHPGIAVPSQIFLLGPDGVEQRLTGSGASDPTWSPDGRAIAFSARRGGNLSGDRDIFVMNADGSHIRRLAGTAGDDVDPDWSPDGSRIAFHNQHDDNAGGIWVASVRTRTLTRLTPGAHSRSVGAMDPAWSPDGRWIAYSRYSPFNTLNGRIYAAELWLIRSDGADEKQISEPDGNRVKENPSWSPDGRLIVFERHSWNGSGNRVLVIDPKTGRERSLLAGAPGAVAGPGWSKKGILVSFPGYSAFEPRQAPPGFQVEAPRIDATVTLTRSSCELDIPDTIHPGRLRLELVNDSHLEALFRVVRMGRGKTVDQLRADPPPAFFGERWSVSLESPTTRVWRSMRSIESGRWAVVCHKDKIPFSNGIWFVNVGVAGPITVG